jgi:hypothetical protein
METQQKHNKMHAKPRAKPTTTKIELMGFSLVYSQFIKHLTDEIEKPTQEHNEHYRNSRLLIQRFKIRSASTCNNSHKIGKLICLTSSDRRCENLKTDRTKATRWRCQQNSTRANENDWVAGSWQQTGAWAAGRGANHDWTQSSWRRTRQERAGAVRTEQENGEANSCFSFTCRKTEIGQHTGGRRKLDAGDKNERAAGYAGLQIEYTHEVKTESLTEKPARMNSVGDKNQIGLVGLRKITMEEMFQENNKIWPVTNGIADKCTIAPDRDWNLHTRTKTSGGIQAGLASCAEVKNRSGREDRRSGWHRQNPTGD